MAHTQSGKWESESFREMRYFRRRLEKRRRVVKLYDKLDYLPKTIQEEKEHKEIFDIARATYYDNKRESGLISGQQSEITPQAFGGKVWTVKPAPDVSTTVPNLRGLPIFTTVIMHSRTAVLAQPSIWADYTNGVNDNKRSIFVPNGFTDIDLLLQSNDGWPSDIVEVRAEPDWPCAQEFKYEGDDRIKTDLRHGRFLPVPRIPGNDTVTWQQLPFADQWPLDQVHCGSNFKKPDVEDVTFGEYEVGLDDGLIDCNERFGNELLDNSIIGHRFLGDSLMDALDPKGIFGLLEDS